MKSKIIFLLCGCFLVSLSVFWMSNKNKPLSPSNPSPQSQQTSIPLTNTSNSSYPIVRASFTATENNISLTNGPEPNFQQATIKIEDVIRGHDIAIGELLSVRVYAFQANNIKQSFVIALKPYPNSDSVQNRYSLYCSSISISEIFAQQP